MSETVGKWTLSKQRAVAGEVADTTNRPAETTGDETAVRNAEQGEEADDHAAPFRHPLRCLELDSGAEVLQIHARLQVPAAGGGAVQAHPPPLRPHPVLPAMAATTTMGVDAEADFSGKSKLDPVVVELNGCITEMLVTLSCLD